MCKLKIQKKYTNTWQNPVDFSCLKINYYLYLAAYIAALTSLPNTILHIFHELNNYF